MSSKMKFDVEKFIEKNNFCLWQVKMWAILVQQGLVKVLEGVNSLSTMMSNREKQIALKKVHSAIILCLDDKVLQEVSKEKNATEVWLKIESLYMTKSLANRLFLKQKLYSFKMASGWSIEDHIDDVHRLVLDLENIEVEVEDEDQALILLSSLPDS